MADEKPKSDKPPGMESSKITEAGDLAMKFGISVDRAQMLIDRLGHDPEALDAAAKTLSTKIKSGR